MIFVVLALVIAIFYTESINIQTLVYAIICSFALVTCNIQGVAGVPDDLPMAKTGILSASAIAGVSGYFLLKYLTRENRP